MATFPNMLELNAGRVNIPARGYPAIRRAAAPPLRHPTATFTGVSTIALALSRRVRPEHRRSDRANGEFLGGVRWGNARILATSASQRGSGDDIWRDSFLRYAGYANEVGEAFRNVAPKAVLPSYGVSFAYVLGDTIDKAYQGYAAGKSQGEVALLGLDVLLWQTLASVAIPGLTINLAVRAITADVKDGALKRILPPAARKYAPTVLGLAIIPLIISPIDEFVTMAMDKTVRNWFEIGTSDDE